MSTHPYIAIEGVIGVGKTTLTRLLQRELGGQAILEEFEENPFLSSFYGDPERYAFQTQIFFLLSRFRQQTNRVPSALLQGPVIADYTFAKDMLFAQLNLQGDELSVYERVYNALSEKVQRTDLLIYLRADLDVLMGRIAARDRSFERNMDPDYIDQLRRAYDDFARDYDDSTILTIDTNDLNFVQNTDDIAHIVERVKSTLEYGSYQTQLPGVDTVASSSQSTVLLRELETGPQRLTEFQQFHITLDAEKSFDTDVFFNFILLNEEIGELARVFKKTWKMEQGLQSDGLPINEARFKALEANRVEFKDELADCFAYLLKISNYAGVDLEQAYIEKMTINTNRHWDEITDAN